MCVASHFVDAGSATPNSNTKIILAKKNGPTPFLPRLTCAILREEGGVVFRGRVLAHPYSFFKAG